MQYPSQVFKDKPWSNAYLNWVVGTNKEVIQRYKILFSK